MYRFVAVVALAAVAATAQQSEILRSFYRETNGQWWDRKDGWSDPSSTDPCGWYGIQCRDGNVTSIMLGANGLRGSLPEYLFEELAKLTSLEHLYLRLNGLVGPLPKTIGKLTSLRQLSVSRNQFTGTLPDTIGKLTKLWDLDLERNKFTGALPESLGLTSLERIFVHYNGFTSLPKSIGNLTKLEWVDMEYNQLSGALPESMAKLTSLEQLDLGYNQLSGTLQAIGNLPKLRRLFLTDNRFEGVIPQPLCAIECSAAGNSRLCSRDTCGCRGVPRC